VKNHEKSRGFNCPMAGETRHMNLAGFASSEFSLELRLLLACCCNPCAEQHRDHIGQWIREGVNWNTFIQLVHYHQVLPFVYVNLQKYAADVIPSPELNRLKTQYKKQKIHSLKLAAELIRLVKGFRQEGINVICLKGPVLALQLYGDITLRQLMDIDLLVENRDLMKVHQLLIHRGYESQHPELFSSNLHWKVFKKSKHHLPYVHREKSVNLEIHFRLFKNLHVFPNRALNAWTCHQTVIYAGVPLNALSLIDNMIFLFAHGSIHKWHLLKWLTDMAQLCHSPAIDWEKLHERAAAVGLQRPVLQGLLLLNHLFAIPLPGIFSQFPAGKPVTKITHHALRVIKESRETAKYGFRFALRERFYLLKLKQGMRYKLRYLRDLFYLDSHRGILRLPPYLFPLYLVLNPFLWFYKNYLRNKKKC
jgi:hypothetical protein